MANTGGVFNMFDSPGVRANMGLNPLAPNSTPTTTPIPITPASTVDPLGNFGIPNQQVPGGFNPLQAAGTAAVDSQTNPTTGGNDLTYQPVNTFGEGGAFGTGMPSPIENVTQALMSGRSARPTYFNPLSALLKVGRY